MTTEPIVAQSAPKSSTTPVRRAFIGAKGCDSHHGIAAGGRRITP